MARPRPFLKWAGGKRRLVDAITRAMPRQYGAYHEPFVGGGALFFHVAPARAYLSDSNERLVRAYKGVRDAPDEVTCRLRALPHTRATFLRLRRRAIDARTDAEVAAWFIYLNKTGYNGLYRVNRRNEFNVPFGGYRNPNVCDDANLAACARSLRGAEIGVADFSIVLERAARGDFVYFDPPYAPLSATASFTSYTAMGFTAHDQRRVRDIALELKRRGASVLVSNSASPLIRELYAGSCFKITTVSAPRALSCKSDGRGRVDELLIR